MSVEISAENRQEYQAWTPVEEDLEGLPKNIYDVILQMRVDCSTTDRNRMPYYGAVDDIDEFTDIPYIDDGTRVVPEKLRTLDHGRPWSDDQFASTRLSSSRDMSR